MSSRGWRCPAKPWIWERKIDVSFTLVDHQAVTMVAALLSPAAARDWCKLNPRVDP